MYCVLWDVAGTMIIKKGDFSSLMSSAASPRSDDDDFDNYEINSGTVVIKKNVMKNAFAEFKSRQQRDMKRQPPPPRSAPPSVNVPPESHDDVEVIKLIQGVSSVKNVNPNFKPQQVMQNTQYVLYYVSCI